MLSPDLIAAYDGARPLANRSFRAACYAPFVSLYLRPTGDVQACCKNELFLLGNVASASLLEIWRGARAGQLRRALKNYAFGAGCEHCEWQIRNGNFAGAYTRIFDDVPGPLEVPEWPAMLEFAITNTCNLECIMCTGDLSSAIRARRDRLPPLPKVYGDAFFDELRAFLPHLQRAKFFGGEPFLAEECWRIFDLMIAAGRPIPSHVTTNGTIWNAAVERVLEHVPVSVTVSIDGATAATFERIRLNASFEVVMRNLERFVAATRRRGTGASISFCLMRDNWHEFFDVLRIAERFGCQVWINTVVEPPSSSLFTLPRDEQLRIADELDDIGRGRLGEISRNRHVWDNEIQGLRTHGSAGAGGNLTGVLPLKFEGRESADPLVQAWPLVRAGRLDEGLAILETVTPQDSRFWRARILRSHVLRLQGRLAESEAQAVECARAAPQRPEPHVELTWIRLAQGQLVESLADAERALDLVHGNASLEVAARQALAAALLRIGRADDALAQLELVRGLEPDLPEVALDHGWLLEVLALRGRMTSGRDPVRDAWRSCESGRFEEALAELDRIEEDVRASLPWKMARAHALRRLGRYDEAEAELCACIEADPRSPDPHAELAWIRLEQGRGEESLALARRALERASGHAPEAGALHVMGAACLATNRLAEAHLHLDRLVRLQPGQAQFRLARAEASLRLARHADALADAEWVLASAPDEPWAAKLVAAARAGQAATQ